MDEKSPVIVLVLLLYTYPLSKQYESGLEYEPFLPKALPLYNLEKIEFKIIRFRHV